ncbi:MAG: hypothetical protein ACRD2X_08175 [Vicinamibacteraceae bacterium]
MTRWRRRRRTRRRARCSTKCSPTPGVPTRWRTREVDAPLPPLLTVVFRRNDRELRFFSTFTTFGTPRDITVDELRIECAFPADDATAELCRTLARNDPDARPAPRE